MRLLQLEENGGFSLVEYVGNDIPPYAILSHTWGRDGDEVTFQDLMNGTSKAKPGYDKVSFCVEQATRDGLTFAWIDTCCIDKSNSTELSEAINSMFRWYQSAERCYVYLSDVRCNSSDGDDSASSEWKPAFKQSRWFTRGWTLQELIAPASIEFFSANGTRLGDRMSLLQDIHDITKITVKALQRSNLSQFSIEERLSWAESRQTKRDEDMIYSLLGIFDVHMPLIYGEGREKALARLRKEIRECTNNQTLAIGLNASKKDQNDAHASNCIAISASEFTFSYAKDSVPCSMSQNFRDSVDASGYPDSMPYNRAFKENPIHPAEDQIIRIKFIDSLCIRGRATNIPKGLYDVKWIFYFPELRYIQLMPDDCPFRHRLLALQSLNGRVSYNFHLWLRNKLNPIFSSSNLSLSAGQTLSDDFMEQAVDGTQYTSPVNKLFEPGYQERKLSPLTTDKYRNIGWCELESDKFVAVAEHGQLAFIIWKKWEPLWLSGFAFGGVRLQRRV
ncbi:heterokaryon incompatibility protein-domain-containing protein [Paraphoma chrysanthemicola]|nr:heterokaryon incompatibility protein-domain-containing protein [Paraphoma chrysanthemicola]